MDCFLVGNPRTPLNFLITVKGGSFFRNTQIAISVPVVKNLEDFSDAL